MKRAISSLTAAGWLLASCALAPAALAQTTAITGGKIVIGDGSEPIEGGTVVIRNGTIIAAGANVQIPAGADIVDASGSWVTPGIFAGFSRVGLVEVSAVSGTNDASASGSEFNAGLDIAPAIDPFRSAIAISRAAGITRAVVAPSAGRNMFAGQGAVADLGADPDPVTKAKAFQFVEFGENGARIAGGSRSASHLTFRAMLREAADYAAGKDSFDDNLLRAEDAKALLPVVQGRTKLLVHVEGANDILRVIELKKDFPELQLVLVGASEGWRVADRIAAAKIPVIASALNDLPATFEQLGATQSNIGRLKRAGVEVAIGMIDDNDAHQLRYSAQYAGNLVSLTKVPGASGLSWNEAFAAITSKPADIIGVGTTHGSLKAGRAADVVIWDGDPLELSTLAQSVYVDGVLQPLDNRQARLRDRYRIPSEGDLPKAYDR
ncbi:amidohydrolase family protein [Sphingorhabdus arenilitoris]|uniref:Amidohydrolase family protein n=1 Tax=Sphingorhabdus arenilitoris TaxID=1490041 RepID=A0ABV8RFS9_9SPHN